MQINMNQIEKRHENDFNEKTQNAVSTYVDLTDFMLRVTEAQEASEFMAKLDSYVVAKVSFLVDLYKRQGRLADAKEER